MDNSISKYMDYIKRYPGRFINNDLIHMVLDEDELRSVSQQLNRKVGVVYENEFITLIVDLIKREDKSYYTYARILNKNEYNGVVVIPILKDKIVFLKQFRHAIRAYDLELPRGFSEAKDSPEQNVLREVYEELSAQAYDIQYIGEVFSDTGLVGGIVKVFTCQIDEIGKLEKNEGIEDIVLLTREEIRQYISQNLIKDSFSISAICKFDYCR